MSDEREARLEKLAALRAEGIDPYPARSHRTHTAAETVAHFDELQSQGQQITLVGRLMLRREMGKSVFANIEDGSANIQIYFKRDTIGDEAFQRLKLVDLGDFLQVTGTLFTTKTGEKTLAVQRYELLSKSLTPLPAKGAGGDLKLSDPEVRHRKRYLDLLANREVEFPIFQARARILSSMRQFLDARGFIEVETPILQPLYGGATARPFVTHHNTLDRDFYLRIAPELYLKRLIVGGFERVYEIGRSFRNEGMDREHNPEFSTMEFYQAYADFEEVMRQVEEMHAHITLAVCGTLQISYLGMALDMTPPFQRLTLREAIAEYAGIDYDKYPERDALAEVMRKKGHTVDPKLGRGKLIDNLKDSITRGRNPKITGPTFLYDYPFDISPLAKRKPDDPNTTERFQLFAGGLEMGNAFSELNDPLDQRVRFEDQARQRAGGDEEAQVLDEDYIEALEVGMPPTGGWGGGIEKLTMLLTNQETIREVILFPALREQHE
ncbi:MAG TPA: lysine--tRNA ligase [Ktedonobacterales bacterium]|nr:lysine--tRNA ligase [Ktedonobacterales bacterium]